jgi:hypothetical protein
MSQQTIGVGTAANDGTGDPARIAFQKVNANFTELYNADTAFTSALAAKAPLVSPTLVTPNLGVALATSINGITLTNGGSGVLTVTGTASVSGTNTGDQDLSGYATTTALALKAPLASPTFTGTPAAPTAAAGTNTTQLATTAFVKAALDLLVNAAPGALDTLKELADAIGDDANYAATVTTALAGKQPVDATLTALAAVVTAANKLIYATGVDTFATADLTAAGRDLIDDADAAAQRATLALDVTAANVYYQTPAAGTLVLTAKAAYAFTISQIRGLKTSAGTLTLAVQINGTNVTGLSALSVTSTTQDVTATAANSVAVGDRVTVVLSGLSSAADLEFTLKGVR